jgi:hypothetical protein
MRKLIFATILGLLFCSALFAQSTPTADTAANNVQPSPGVSSLEFAFTELKIPAGTPIDIQTTDIISSMDTKAGI